MVQRICKFESCDNLIGQRGGHGWCGMHYQRWRKHGDPGHTRDSSPKVCKFDGCSSELGPASGRGWCAKHYLRWKRHGDPAYTRSRVVDVGTCTIEGCDKIIKARGWCAAHWSRWQRHGSPTARLRGEVVDGRRICPMCGVDKPLDEWRAAYCTDCTSEFYWRHGSVRRSRMLDAFRESFDRVEIFDRDGWNCALCELPVDRDLKYPDRLSASLDHIVPLSRGGEHSRDNTQCTHLVCNLRKHARVETPV